MHDGRPPTLTDTVAGDEGLRPPPDLRASQVAPGHVIGRYVVLGQVGAGGMGVVHAAYDAELDRRVAVKLMHGDRDERHEARLIREARAMARLSHTNVVTVHDVGIHAGRVFVAMEYVDGETLGRWAKRERPWREVLDLMIAAGRGLAAAHAADLLHRDFKPDNVMIDRAGRVRVLDFGLAATTGTVHDESPDASPPEVEGASTGPGDSKLSRTGHVMGTPAYLAPELHRGEAATVASDQFAFCVALCEALYGRRPFAGDNVAQLALNVTRGLVEEPPNGTPVPRAVWRIIRRGLSVEPRARFSSMSALLAELERIRGTSRRGLWALPAVVAALAGASWIGAGSEPQVCAGAERRVAEIWSAEQAKRVADRFAAANELWLVELGPSIEEALRAWAARWAAAHRAACEARNVRGEWSSDLLDRSTACLEERLGELEAAVDLLTADDPTARRRAIELTEALPAPEPCTDPRRLLAQVPGPEDPEIAERVARLRAEIATGVALITAGRYDDAYATLSGLEAEVLDTGYPPLIASLYHRLAGLKGRAGDYRAEARGLRDAYFEAVAAGDDRLAVLVATELVFTHAVYLEDYDGAETWLRHARAFLASRVHDPHVEAGVADAAGALRRQRGDHAAAAAEYGLAIGLLEAGDDPVRLAEALANAGHLELERGNHQKALALIRRAREIRTALYGAGHPAVVDSLVSTATALKRVGDLDQAATLTREGLEGYLRIYGEHHPNVGGALHNLGAIELERDDLDAATQHLERAVRIRRAAHGEDHPLVAASMSVLGSAKETGGELEAARALYEEALGIFEARLGNDHPHVASVLNNIGTVSAEAGDLDGALRAHERALSIRRTKLEPEHPDIAQSLVNLGNLLRRRGDHDGAIEAFERAVEIHTGSTGATHPITLSARGNLGAVLVETRPEEAIPLLREVIESLEKGSGPNDMDLAAPLTNLGRAYLATGDAGAAEAPLRRSLALRESSASALDKAGTRFLLARALARRDPAEASQLARAARAELARAPERNATPIAEIDAFLDTVGG